MRWDDATPRVSGGAAAGVVRLGSPLTVMGRPVSAVVLTDDAARGSGSTMDAAGGRRKIGDVVTALLEWGDLPN